MSDQLTSQSRPSSGISRRTALRGAAWSASAVTVVVATPNIAAASTTGTASGSSATRNDKVVTATITLSNGTGKINENSLKVTLAGGSVAVAPAGWVRVSGYEFTYSGAVLPAGTAVFQATGNSSVLLDNNSPTNAVTFTFKNGTATLDTWTYTFNRQTQSNVSGA